MQRSILPPLTGLLLGLCLTACPSTNTGPDAGVDAGVDASVPPLDGGEDAGTDAGFSCTQDDDCAVFGENQRCQTNPGPDQGQCIAGTLCNQDLECSSGDIENYCWEFGDGCRCVQEKAEDGFSGVCRRRVAVCGECTTDAECGTGASFNPEGICRAVDADGTGPKYCLRKQTGAGCPCGYVNNGEGYCKPQSGACPHFGCTIATEANDCGAGQVCNAVGNGCGVCAPRCNWDFARKEPAPECPVGQVCWVDQPNLNPLSQNFGAGRCRAPCTGDGQCAQSVNNPMGGPDLVCQSEELAGGNQSALRCRADGECMSDDECPVLPSTSLTDGYCDRGSLTCETDCRVGIDPTTGGEFNDCRPGNKCEVQIDGRRQCMPKTCVELGGARVACRPGQYCCGEDLNGDGVIEPCPASTDPVSQCYDAPKPPFCTTCQTEADCAGLPNPTNSPLRSLCMPGPSPDGMTPGPLICHPATVNQPVFETRGCPSTYEAVQVRVPCQQNTDCHVGNTNGICEEDRAAQVPEGQPKPRYCVCTVNDENPSNDVACPNGTGDQVRSFCPYGSPGQEKFCAQSIVCTPRAVNFWSPVEQGNGGCGL